MIQVPFEWGVLPKALRMRLRGMNIFQLELRWDILDTKEFLDRHQ
jgi:hypothetical protein